MCSIVESDRHIVRSSMKTHFLAIFSFPILLFALLLVHAAEGKGVSDRLPLIPYHNGLHSNSTHILTKRHHQWTPPTYPLSLQKIYLSIIGSNSPLSCSLYEQKNQLCYEPIEYMCTNCGALYDVPPEICHDCGNTFFILACGL